MSEQDGPEVPAILYALTSRLDYVKLLCGSGEYKFALGELEEMRMIVEGNYKRFAAESKLLDEETLALWRIIIAVTEGDVQLSYREDMWDRFKRMEKEALAIEAWEAALEVVRKAQAAGTLDLRLAIEPITDACAGLCLLGGYPMTHYSTGEDYVEQWFMDLLSAHSEAVTAEDYERKKNLLLKLKLYRALRYREKRDDEQCAIGLSGICGELTLRESSLAEEACYELGMAFARLADKSELPEQIVSNVVKSNIWLNLALECSVVKKTERAKQVRERISKNERIRETNFRNPLQISLDLEGTVRACLGRKEEYADWAFETLVSLRHNPTSTQAEIIFVEAALVEICLRLDYQSNALGFWSAIKDSELLTPERKAELEEKFRPLENKK